MSDKSPITLKGFRKIQDELVFYGCQKFSKEEIEERKRLVKEMEEARDRADAKWREEHGFESPEKIWSSIAKKTEEAYFWGNES